MPSDDKPLPAPSRRDVLAGAAALAVWPGAARADSRLTGDGAPPFTFNALVEEARARAAQPWRRADPATGPGADFAADLGYDDWRRIRFRPEATRWAGAGAFRLQVFHTGWLFADPVRLFEVADGRAREMVFTTDDFLYDGEDLSARLPANLPAGTPLPGVAGFRLLHPLNAPDRMDELVAFLGASYFRALGRGSAYGLSARGLALNTGTGQPEEFPRFKAFYLERPSPDAETVTLHAALESESVAGAFRFVVRPGDTTVMDVTAHLFFRSDVELLGVAPLTSMFLYDDKNRAGFDDFRPRVHDSNGLSILRTDGRRLWRPLNNPPRLARSSFLDEVARFGLHQRGRDFAAYQDTEARYDRRPSLDVVPEGGWVDGAVRLVEIPTALEINDNIVAFYVEEGGEVSAGEARRYDYALHWGNLPGDGAEYGAGNGAGQPDDPGAPARVLATRAGVGGVSGVPAPDNKRKFAVDFAGGALGTLGPDAPLTARVHLSDGTLVSQVLEPLPDGAIWRLLLDVTAPEGSVVDLIATLMLDGAEVSETWLYQWINAG